MKKPSFYSKIILSVSFIFMLYTKLFAGNSPHGKPSDVYDDRNSGIGWIIFIIIMIAAFIHGKIQRSNRDN
jgi:hypothetical protein